MTLSAAAVMVLASTCQSVIAPETIVSIAQVESGFDPAAIHVNQNGRRDFGLMQIAEANLAWLGLTEQTALDPCQSIAAAGRLYASYSLYNTGSPQRGVANGYVAKVINATAALRGLAATKTTTVVEQCPASDLNGWHVRAVPAHCHDNADGWHIARR